MAQLLASVFLLGVGAVAAFANSSGWRSDGSGRYPHADPPLSWSSGQNVAWKTSMPSWSNASPVLTRRGAEATIFVCSEPDKILAVDARDGRIRWTRSVGDVATGEGVETHQFTGYTSATPVSNGNHVFTVFGSGVVAAHGADGKRLWARVVQQPQHGWGHSASPTLGGGLLIVHIQDLIALDPAHGNEVWRAASEVRFGSPIVVDIGGTDVAITPAGDAFRAVDGKQVAAGLGSLQYATPVVDGDVLYFIEKKATAVRLPDDLAAGFASVQLWQSNVEGSRHYASPVIHGDLIYAVSREERLSILDARTGLVLHERALDLGSGSNSAYASVTLAGSRLFVSASNGSTVVLESGRTYRELARNKVEEFRTTPVFDGDRMYLRAAEYLYCIGGD